MAKPVKKGDISKTEAGELVLVNEQGQAFKVDETAILFWNRCDGQTTIEDLTKEFSQKTKQEESVIKQVIETLINNMAQVGLIQSVE